MVNAVKCPFCLENETKVIDKRATSDGEMNRRRRECIKCSKRFTTYEKVEHIGLNVIKKDGSVQPFDREKIKNGILKACKNIEIPPEKISAIVESVEKKIKSRSSSRIKSQMIGDIVMKKLQAFDQEAYLRFASVYRFDIIKGPVEKELKRGVKDGK